MKRPIGYYVHHQGDGHRQRALAIARSAPERFVIIGTGLEGRCEGLNVLELPDDRPASDTVFARPSRCLHYVPYHLESVRQRVAVVANWISLQHPALMVVDVSVEMAMLAQLAATPTLYVRLAGQRNDDAHLSAFAAAHAVIAPFAEALDTPLIEPWVRQKTRYLPGITRLATVSVRQPSTVLVVNGRGGATLDGTLLATAAASTPWLHWRAIGPVSPPPSTPHNLELLGWVADADIEIASAGFVIGSAGDGVVNAVIACGARFICLPQARPYDEQIEKAKRLDAIGAAIVINSWPHAGDWPSLFRRAAALDVSALASLHAPDGARIAAEFFLSVANDLASPA